MGLFSTVLLYMTVPDSAQCAAKVFSEKKSLIALGSRATSGTGLNGWDGNLFRHLLYEHHSAVPIMII